MTTVPVFAPLSTSKGKLKVLMCLVLIAGSLGILVTRGILDSESTFGDFQLFYKVGENWNKGVQIYQTYDVGEPEPRFLNYPPQGALFFGAFSRFPQTTAHMLLLCLNLVLLVLSGGLILNILSWYRKIGIAEITLTICLLCTGFGRANLTNSQIGIVMCFLVLSMFVLINKYDKEGLAGAALALVSIKPHFIPLYFAYYLYKRYWRMLLVCCVVGLAFTIIPLILSNRPVVQTLLDWEQALTHFNQGTGSIDNPAPSPSMASAQLINLEPIVYEIFQAPTTPATITYYVILIIIFAYSGYVIIRGERLKLDDILLDFSIVSTLSLIFIYHRTYDAFVLFPGILYVYLYGMNQKPRWLVFAAVMVLILMLPGDITINIAARFWNIFEHSYIWRVLAHFQAWGTLALLAGLLWLKTQQIRDRKRWVTMRPQAVEPPHDRDLSAIDHVSASG